MPCSGLKSDTSVTPGGGPQHIDGASSVARAAGLVRDQPDTLAAQDRELIGREHVDPGQHGHCRSRPAPLAAASRAGIAADEANVARRYDLRERAPATTVATRPRSAATSPLPSGWSAVGEEDHERAR